MFFGRIAKQFRLMDWWCPSVLPSVCLSTFWLIFAFKFWNLLCNPAAISSSAVSCVSTKKYTTVLTLKAYLFCFHRFSAINARYNFIGLAPQRSCKLHITSFTRLQLLLSVLSLLFQGKKLSPLLSCLVKLPLALKPFFSFWYIGSCSIIHLKCVYPSLNSTVDLLYFALPAQNWQTHNVHYVALSINFQGLSLRHQQCMLILGY